MATAFQGLAASVCSDDAGGPLGRLAAVIGIPKQIELYARPAAVDLLRVRVDRGQTALDCAPGQGFDLVESPDGPAVRFTGALHAAARRRLGRPLPGQRLTLPAPFRRW